MPLFVRQHNALLANDAGLCVVHYALLIHSLGHLRDEVLGIVLRGCQDPRRTFGHPYKSKGYEWGVDFVPQMYPFLQQLRVDYSARTEGRAGVKRAIPHQSRSSCFGLIPVATRCSNQRIPVIRRVAAAEHLLEYDVGIGFAACGP